MDVDEDYGTMVMVEILMEGENREGSGSPRCSLKETKIHTFRAERSDASAKEAIRAVQILTNSL